MTEDHDKFCPACDERRRWFHNDCPECGTPLVAVPERHLDAERPPVGVLTTSDPAALTLANLTLNEAGIRHEIHPAEPADIASDRGVSAPDRSSGEWWTVKVGASDAERAREALVDLEHAAGEPEMPLETSMEWARELPPVELFESDTERTVGHITETQLDWLCEQFDADGVRDREFTLDPARIRSWEQAGADANLVGVLRTALGPRSAVRLRWGFM
jgi:hypothetical protein